MAKVTCWAKNCIIGSSTKIGQVSRFSVTTAMIKLIVAYWPKGCIAIELIELQICLNLSLIMVLWHTHIYICRLVPLYRIEFWSRPTHMQFFKLLTCKLSERSCFFRIDGTANKWSWIVTLSVGRCLITVQTKYWLNTQVHAQHMIQGNPFFGNMFLCKVVNYIFHVLDYTRSWPNLSAGAMITRYKAEVAVHCFQLISALVSKNHMTAVFYFL